jgi:ankyrin repeat protein
MVGEGQEGCDMEESFWDEKIECLLKSESGSEVANERNKNGDTALHIVICEFGTSSDAKKRVFDLLLKLHPEAVQTLNDSGDLPLHVAVAPLTHGTPGHLLEQLLKLHPEGAARKNKEGKLPLHLAISSKNTMAVASLLKIHSEGDAPNLDLIEHS